LLLYNNIARAHACTHARTCTIANKSLNKS